MSESRISIRSIKDKEGQNTICRWVFPETNDIIGSKNIKKQMLCVLWMGDDIPDGADEAIAGALRALIDSSLDEVKVQFEESQTKH